ncbi:MAG: enoyl-CoA hydratase/isomerase family protein, partial [Acidimicrobiia bacterium]|nr:enoyl-CoA hydratase/isomerase family protein [Acidimicrobiia bacterium]
MNTDFETLGYEERDGVAWVTLNRPDRLNAFNNTMQRELKSLWRGLRRHDDVRCIVLTGAGDRAFCTGIDRTEQMGSESVASNDEDAIGSGDQTPFMFNDPGDNIGPKSCDLWKPVIAAVNGMACGGAFYMLGEVEFIIAADHATFFDPHVTYGMTAAFEPMHMSGITPFGDIMRMSLLGNYERLSAARALEVGMVSEVVPGVELHERADWAARIIASQPPLAIQGTVRSIWAAREMGPSQALRLGYA